MSTGTRIEAVAIALVFMAASLVLAFHTQHKGAPVYGDFPPSAAPATSAPHPKPAQPGLVEARFEQPAASPARTTRRTTRTPSVSQPASPRAPGPQGVWTWCQTQGGGLACQGRTGTFTCTTAAATGTTSCKGSGVSITCATDPQTGARQCDTPTDSWRCVTNPDSARTGCAGTNGSYSCAPTANATESCNGLRSFRCYDFADGRSCGTSKSPAPDCYFEPIFGVFCRT
jgi:hypothetical protein